MYTPPAPGSRSDRPAPPQRGVRIARGIGLSKAHISPRRARVTAFCGASTVSLTPPRRVDGRVGGGKRGMITEFSKHSRRRLLRLIGMIDRSCGKQLFVTLTYPKEFPDMAESKRHLDVFLKRLKRVYPNAAAIWRLEFQKRGAPHYHLLVWNVDFIDYRWLATAWYEVVGSGDEKHLKAGTQVKRVRSWRGVWSYASKYLAKMPETEIAAAPGRFWGVHNRERLPVVIPTIVTITERTFWRLQLRMMKERGKVFQLHNSTVVHYCDEPHIWLATALRLDPDAKIEDWKS